MDVKIAFLHGNIEEQIYMEKPDRFNDTGHALEAVFNAVVHAI